MDDEQLLDDSIREWARSKSANVSLASHRYEFEAWTQLTGVTSVEHMVDVGCGSGLFDVSAVVLGYADRATGIDPTEESQGTTRTELEETRELVDEVGLSDEVSFTLGYWPETSIPNCDLLVFRSALHHILESGMHRDELIDNLSTARDTLARDGHIYIRETTPARQLQWRAQQVYRRVRGSGPLSRDGKLTVEDWQSILRKSGYDNVQATRVPPNLFINSSIPSAPTRVLSTSCLITATPR